MEYDRLNKETNKLENLCHPPFAKRDGEAGCKITMYDALNSIGRCAYKVHVPLSIVQNAKKE